MKKTFSIKSLFSKSWEDYKNYWGMFIFVGIIFALVSLIGNFSVGVNPYTGLPQGSFFVGLIIWLLQIFLSLGFIHIILNIVDKREAKLEQLFNGASSFHHYIYFAVAVLLYSAVVGLGIILLIIPGIILGIGFFFVQYLMAEERTGIFESFKESWRMTRGNRWKIFWFMIVVTGFNILGALALFVGLLITLPMTHLMYGRLYRELSGTEATADSMDDKESIIIEETVIIEEVPEK